METLAYGLFPNRAAADAAIARLDLEEVEDVVTVHEHVGELPDEDIQGPGTRSWLFAVAGGGFAALLGGVLAAIFLGDRFMYGPLATGAVGAVAAGAFGVLAAIAGTSLPRRELERLQRDIAEGKALVTIDVQTKHTSDDLQVALERCGALRTGVLYGPGFGTIHASAGRRLKA